MTHIIPLVISTINLFYLSDVAVNTSDIWVSYAVGFAYIIINYSLLQISGEPTYAFLTYDSWDSYLFIFGAFFVETFNHVFDAILTQWLTGRW